MKSKQFMQDKISTFIRKLKIWSIHVRGNNLEPHSWLCVSLVDRLWTTVLVTSKHWWTW